MRDRCVRVPMNTFGFSRMTERSRNGNILIESFSPMVETMPWIDGSCRTSIGIRECMPAFNHTHSKSLLKLAFPIAVGAPGPVAGAKGARLEHASGSLWPHLVWTHGERLIRTEIGAFDVGEDEVLRRYGKTRQTAQERKLSSVRHCIAERALQQNLRGRLHVRAEFYMPSDIRQRFMEVGDRSLKV